MWYISGMATETNSAPNLDEAAHKKGFNEAVHEFIGYGRNPGMTLKMAKSLIRREGERIETVSYWTGYIAGNKHMKAKG